MYTATREGKMLVVFFGTQMLMEMFVLHIILGRAFQSSATWVHTNGRTAQTFESMCCMKPLFLDEIYQVPNRGH
jgi:hypothetical protein